MRIRTTQTEVPHQQAIFMHARETMCESFQSLRLESLNWKEEGNARSSDAERSIKVAKAKFKMDSRLYTMDCIHYDDEVEQVNRYEFKVQLNEKPGCAISLFIFSKEDEPNYASTDIDRLDEEERVLPPGFGPKLLGKVMDFIASKATPDRHIEHEVKPAPVGYTLEQWHEKFDEVLEEHDYKPTDEGTYSFTYKGIK